jgi:nickel/cobalt exporter
MTGRWVGRLSVLAAGIVVAAVASLALAPGASAHPLGNFTVNQYSGLRVQPDGVLVDYVLDMAEIPSFQTRGQEIDADRDGRVSTAERDRWRAMTCRRLSTQVTVSVDSVVVPLTISRSTLTFPPGTAGLFTLRLGCTLRGAARLDRPTHLSYRDDAYTDRVGWREVTATGDGTTLLASTVPAESTSDRLTAYPASSLAAPLDVRTAELDARPGGTPSAVAPAAAGPRAPLARGVDRATAAFTSLVGHRRLTVAFGLAAVLLSVLLGALHALAPGHGKTVMAAFLVGGRGSLRQAVTVGLTVTATHTVGVLVLGAVLTTSVALAPQRLYPWLGLASGVLLGGVGVTLFRRGTAGASGPGSSHAHSHGHGHNHESAAIARTGPGPSIRRRALLMMGFAGGMVPSPSALVVLLGAVALGRTWLGILLVVGYGAGMAAALVGIGLLLARGRRFLERRSLRPRALTVIRLLPALTAGLIVAVGLGVAAQAAVALLSA